MVRVSGRFSGRLRGLGSLGEKRMKRGGGRGLRVKG